ncbi:hypothetical protein EDI_155870 [Entamoeba dispar SAW760]|uniref:TLDc domain-containing protein n=1 Tax=Entamoeba dispar (strain ATCC PRA-260 / SAW760) TaxID=370354 RepID=B0ES67_ENTDS|nr:uncharacterized protein EDI_155870 [Entamoeba dispar SAW760]EDR22628.1 hypothetical protein EDI_155870 [Entamoeba dispar SAW760]|eukprot:EDR22628.1 hypothetical protein EDI_155870 [Entamoeba dispar SAW760]
MKVISFNQPQYLHYTDEKDRAERIVNILSNKEVLTLYDSNNSLLTSKTIFNYIQRERDVYFVAEDDNDNCFGCYISKAPSYMGIGITDQHHYIFSCSLESDEINTFDYRILTTSVYITLDFTTIFNCPSAFSVDDQLNCSFSKDINVIYMKEPNSYCDVSKYFPCVENQNSITLKRIRFFTSNTIISDNL